MRQFQAPSSATPPPSPRPTRPGHGQLVESASDAITGLLELAGMTAAAGRIGK
jgi:hypothetical protein